MPLEKKSPVVGGSKRRFPISATRSNYQTPKAPHTPYNGDVFSFMMQCSKGAYGAIPQGVGKPPSATHLDQIKVGSFFVCWVVEMGAWGAFQFLHSHV